MDLILDIETTGINPLASRITAIGLLFKNNERPFIIMRESEKEMILELKRILDGENAPGTIIGWHIKDFDVPFIKIRALKYRIPLWIDARIIDLSFYFEKPERIHMKDLAEFLGIEHIKTASVLMPDAFHDGNFKKIEEHLKDDLLAVKRIWEIWNECL